jgi:uncharacterized protein (DUF2141 family)
MSILIAVAMLASPEEASHTVRGTISNCSGEHTIFIALFDSNDFFTQGGKAQQWRKVPATEVKNGKVVYEFKVAPGEYGVAAFEDEDEDGLLGFGMFGPTEPQQLYRKFTAWRPPTFEEVKFPVQGNVLHANIELN